MSARDLQHPLLAAVGVAHGFGQRDSEPPPDVVRPRQVHGVSVARIVRGQIEPQEADAIVSTSSDFPVGIVTADCVPVLASSRAGQAVAAIHAGWRGLAAGVVEAGVVALGSQAAASGAPGSELVAVIGPHIGPCCYEVDEPVLAPLRDRFGSELDGSLRASGSEGHWMLDLARLVELELERAGIAAADRGSIPDSCTFCSRRGGGGSPRFHSYRRDGNRAGRILHHLRPNVRPKRSS